MQAMFSAEISVDGKRKAIEVYHEDIAGLDMPVDILTISAFWGNYAPSSGTMIGALKDIGIDVRALARDAEIDLRGLCHVWLSKPASHDMIHRIGCMELLDYDSRHDPFCREDAVIKRIHAYFTMLDLAGNAGVPMKVVALPLIGSGNQKLDGDLVVAPLISECVGFLRRNTAVERLIFVERSPSKAFKLATQLSQSYQLHQETAPPAPRASDPRQNTMAFLSYNRHDASAMEQLCARLEDSGVRVWYAPRDISSGDYASAIVTAIQRANCFIPLISRSSLQSQHVLNEINLAFNSLQPGRCIIPARLEEVDMGPSFQYYLARYQWVDLFRNPLELAARQLVERVRGI